MKAAEKAKFLAEVNRKFVEDSITRAKAQADRLAIRQAEETARQDSLTKAQAAERKKAFEDTLATVVRRRATASASVVDRRSDQRPDQPRRRCERQRG